METNGKHCAIFISIILVLIANANTSPTPNLNRLLRLRDSDRGIGNGKYISIQKIVKNHFIYLGFEIVYLLKIFD